jgi:hypothetical protein
MQGEMCRFTHLFCRGFRRLLCFLLLLRLRSIVGANTVSPPLTQRISQPSTPAISTLTLKWDAGRCLATLLLRDDLFTLKIWLCRLLRHSDDSAVPLAHLAGTGPSDLENRMRVLLGIGMRSLETNRTLPVLFLPVSPVQHQELVQSRVSFKI